MAETPLTDSIEALTTYANQVTGASDTNLSDAVYTLTQGYGGGGSDLINYATRLGNLFSGASNLPSKIELAPIKLASGDINADVAANVSGLVELSIHFSQNTAFSLYRLIFSVSPLKKLTLTGNLNLCTSYMNAFQQATSLEELDAVLDFSACTNNNTCIINSASTPNRLLTEMRFAENTCSKSLGISGFAALSDASIVSAANCLVAGVSGQSLTLNATPKARCSTLIGVNNNGAFEIDATGTLTLADFITTVKGWTLS